MIGRMHNNWDTEIILDENDLEKLARKEVLNGDLARYPDKGKLTISAIDDPYTSFVSLNWNLQNPKEYKFVLNPKAIEILKSKENLIGYRYENGLNGSKIDLYITPKKNLIEDIEFSFAAIELFNRQNNSPI